MIIRSRRKNESLFQRLFGRRKTTPVSKGVHSQESFLFELARETSRSNRRSNDREFSLVIYSIDVSKKPIELFEKAIAELALQMRIYDVVGWYGEHLAILLPETDAEDATLFAEKVSDSLLVSSFAESFEILTYPNDDELVSFADIMKTDARFSTDSGLPLDEEEKNTRKLQQEIDRGRAQSGDSAFSLLEERANMCGFNDGFPTPWWKRAIDIAGAGTGVILLSPVFLTAAATIKLTSKGPVFFKQIREGKDGQQFGIWKFRTMVVDAEALQAELLDQSEQDGPAFKLTNDPRITPVGKYLRKSCIDELPQLFNVLRGEMSLVGPRPLPVHESHACRPWQRQRLRVLPGLTCIWQVDGGRDTPFEDWMRMDMEYLRKRSFIYDLKLIFRTACLAILHRGSV